MGFFNDFLKGAATEAKSDLDEMNKADLEKQRIVETSNQVMKQKQFEEALAEAKDNGIRQNKLAAVKTYIAQHPGLSQEVQNNLIMGAIGAQGMATALTRSSNVEHNAWDTETSKPVWATTDDLKSSNGRLIPLKATPGEAGGPAMPIPQSELKTYQMDASFLKDMNVLRLAFTPASQRTENEQKILAANGLGDVDVSKSHGTISDLLGPTGLIIGSASPALASHLDPAGTELRQFIEGSQLDKRWELFKSRYTAETAQAAGHAFLDNKFTPEQTAKKIDEILGRQIQPQVNENIQTMRDNYNRSEPNIASLLNMNYQTEGGPRISDRFSIKYDSPNFNQDKTMGVPDYQNSPTAAPAASSAGKWNDFTSPSASASVRQLTTPQPDVSALPPAPAASSGVPVGVANPNLDPLTKNYMQPGMVTPNSGSSVPGSDPNDLARQFKALPPDQQNGSQGMAIKQQLQTVLKLKNSPQQ